MLKASVRRNVAVPEYVWYVWKNRAAREGQNLGNFLSQLLERSDPEAFEKEIADYERLSQAAKGKRKPKKGGKS
jgi:hypothetical protein